MTLAFLIYSAAMTLAIFAVSVYLFVKDIPSTGLSVMLFSFFSGLITVHIFVQYSHERIRRAELRQLTGIEVVVVPSLIIRGRQYPVGLPKDSPSIQHAQ